MTRPEDRQTLVRDISQARAEGARLAAACAVAGIDARTLQRWQSGRQAEGRPGEARELRADRRPSAVRPTPSHALSEAERAQIIAVANEPRFADTPPARIVPMLADEGRYIASESSFHRVLRAHGQMRRRGRARPPRRMRPPTTHIAARPGAVWCWDVTFLPARAQGLWFYLYLIVDLYSRKIVGFEVHDTDSAEHAAHLARRTALSEGVHGMADKPVLHGDNGATLKATTVLAMLHWLGIKPSYSRPRVSDDNAFAEALFRTAKYRPDFPVGGFADRDAARQWASLFVSWYNDEHRHSAIGYITPGQRHGGQDRELLGARHALYQAARQRTPRRWSRQTRNWTPAGPVTLNPERDELIGSATAQGLPSSSIGKPAFPSRPATANAVARNEGEERSGATRSHAQRVLTREHGEDGEHRTFPAVSTTASSPHVGQSPIAASPPNERTG
jgi:transposase InsO family protein